MDAIRSFCHHVTLNDSITRLLTDLWLQLRPLGCQWVRQNNPPLHFGRSEELGQERRGTTARLWREARWARCWNPGEKSRFHAAGLYVHVSQVTNLLSGFDNLQKTKSVNVIRFKKSNINKPTCTLSLYRFAGVRFIRRVHSAWDVTVLWSHLRHAAGRDQVADQVPDSVARLAGWKVEVHQKFQVRVLFFCCRYV